MGDQVKGGPGWAFRNSGLMLHGELPETMEKDQDFPASIEVQLLGGDGTHPQHGNICTPGAHMVMEGDLIKQHCMNSSSDLPWRSMVSIEVEVRGHALMKCIMDGETIFTLTHPILDESDPHAKTLIAANDGDARLTGGSISLQSESPQWNSEKVELKPLPNDG